MTITVQYVTSMDKKSFKKTRLEVQPPVKLKSLLSCMSAIDPYKEVKEDLVPCILETGDEIDDNHPWIQAWEPVASLKWGLNVVWLPRGKKIPKKGTVAEEWKLVWRFPNSEIAIRCLLIDLNVNLSAVRQISRCIVGFLPPGDITMPLSTERAKLVYVASNSFAANNRKTGYMTNDWTTDAIYNVLLDEIQERTTHPDPGLIGIESAKLGSKHGPVLLAATIEVNRIFARIYADYPEQVSKVPNPFFSVNFTHKGKRDNFPFYNWYDPSITALCSLILRAAEAVDMPITQDNIGRLNVIVRQYREGDKIGWHTDWKGYTEHVGSLVIANKDPSRGLCFFRNGKQPFMLYEEPGDVYKFSGEVRRKWQHGFSASAAAEGEEPKSLRTTVTFRFFTKEINPWKGRNRKKRYDHQNHNSGMRAGENKLQSMEAPQKYHGGHKFKEKKMKSSKGYYGKSGFGFVKGKTSAEDFERTINTSTKRKGLKPAKPTDMNSYNLLKMLGLHAVKPGYNELCNEDDSLYSNSTRFSPQSEPFFYP